MEEVDPLPFTATTTRRAAPAPGLASKVDTTLGRRLEHAGVVQGG